MSRGRDEYKYRRRCLRLVDGHANGSTGILPREMRRFWLVLGLCSCDTQAGSKPPNPSQSPDDFDRAAALATLTEAAKSSQSCKQADGPTGSGKIAVTFSNSGAVMSARVEGPPFIGTPVGGCIASRFQGVHVPPFHGGTVTVHKTFVIE
jgi:hypothetical protein